MKCRRGNYFGSHFITIKDMASEMHGDEASRHSPCIYKKNGICTLRESENYYTKQSLYGRTCRWYQCSNYTLVTPEYTGLVFKGNPRNILKKWNKRKRVKKINTCKT